MTSPDLYEVRRFALTTAASCFAGEYFTDYDDADTVAFARQVTRVADAFVSWLSAPEPASDVWSALRERVAETVPPTLTLPPEPPPNSTVYDRDGLGWSLGWESVWNPYPSTQLRGHRIGMVWSRLVETRGPLRVAVSGGRWPTTPTTSEGDQQ